MDKSTAYLLLFLCVVVAASGKLNGWDESASWTTVIVAFLAGNASMHIMMAAGMH
jgi:hypothetical protein